MSEFLFYKLISFIFSTGFFFIAWLAKRKVGYWLNPSSIFSLFWLLYTVMPLSFAFFVPINPLVLLYILMFNLCFMLSVYFFNWRTAFELNKEKPPAIFIFNTLMFKRIFYFLSLFALISVFLTILGQGVTVSDILTNPIKVGGFLAGKRYAQDITPTLFSALSFAFSYFSVLFGGIVYAVVPRKKIIIIIFSFAPSLMVMLLQSAKGLFFLSLFIFIGGVLLVRVYNKNYSLFDKKSIKTLFIAGIVVLPLILMSFLSRGMMDISDSQLIINKLTRYLLSYTSGHLYGFSDWFTDRYFAGALFSYKQEEYTLGFYSIMSVFRLLGDMREIPVGVYDEYFSYGLFLKSNIYTVFRGLITDFTLIGSLIVSVSVGFLCNFCFYRLLCEKSPAFYSVFFIIFVAVSYQSYIISSLIWNSMVVLLFGGTSLFFIYFQFISKKLLKVK